MSNSNSYARSDNLIAIKICSPTDVVTHCSLELNVKLPAVSNRTYVKVEHIWMRHS